MPEITKQQIEPSLSFNNFNLLSRQINSLRRKFKDRREIIESNRHISFADPQIQSIHERIGNKAFPPIRSNFLRCWNSKILTNVRPLVIRHDYNFGIELFRNLMLDRYSLLPADPDKFFETCYCYILAGLNIIQCTRRRFINHASDDVPNVDYIIPMFDPYVITYTNNNYAVLKCVWCAGERKNVLDMTYNTFLNLCNDINSGNWDRFFGKLYLTNENIITRYVIDRAPSLSSMLRNNSSGLMTERQEREMINNCYLMRDYLTKENHGSFISKNQLTELIRNNSIPKDILQAILDVARENSLIAVPVKEILINNKITEELELEELELDEFVW